MKNKPKLIIMVGISGAGKSSVAESISYNLRTYGRDCVTVSSDSIRGEICDGGVQDQSKNAEVFQIFHSRIQEHLKSGLDVIADATNITMKSRRAIINAVKGIDCHITAFVVAKQIEDCLEDNLERQYPVPHHVILKQAGRFQVPFYEEGFDDIVLNGDGENEPFFYNDKLDAMSGFEQHNPHHTLDLYEHCMKVARMFREEYIFEYHIQGAMLHDIGKLFTQKFDENGVAHYYQHENAGAYYLLSHHLSLSNSLCLKSDRELLELVFIVNYHMLPMNWNTEKLRDKWKYIFGEEKFNMLTFFHKCDIMGK